MIQIDKILHFLAGFMISTVFQFLGVWMIVPALIIGILKELKDIKTTGFNIPDLVCTFSGGLIATVVWLIYGGLAW